MISNKPKFYLKNIYLTVCFLGHYNPHVIGASLKPNYDAIKWVEDDELFEAWCEGRTGYPVVDAAMMQMNTTGKRRGFEFDQ